MNALASLELAVGFALDGGDPTPLPCARQGSPLAALDAAIMPALLRPPCLVSFSGGRDSSAVLAVAARIARGAGLADPIPITIRVPAARAAGESEWQDRVIRHLELEDWVRLEFTDDELDAVGPVARAAMNRHGLLWPFNAHVHIPLLEAARGGSLLTGIGGDELFTAATSPRAAAVLARRTRPVGRDVRRVALYAAPRPLRRWWYGRRELPLPWLTTAGRGAASAAFAELDAAEPRRLAARLAWLRSLGALTRGPESLSILAVAAGAQLVHPLLERGLWAALAREAPRGGYLGRTEAMRGLFGGLLPDRVLARSDKAGFDEVFFARHSRAFADTWAGEGVPAELVDAVRLRAHWAEPAPEAQSFTLLQAAFLASAAERVEQPLGRLAERVPAAGTAEPPHRQ